MATYNFRYKESKIKQIKRILERFEEEGESRYFDIYIDGLPIVGKTTKVDSFDDWRSEKDTFSEKIEIRIFHSNSNNCDKYILEKEAEKPLNGTNDGGLGELVAREVNAFKTQWELDTLKKELAALKESSSKEINSLLNENEKLAKNNEELEGINEKLESQYSKYSMLGGVAAPFLDNFLKNSTLIRQTPLGGLLGLDAIPTNNATQAIPLSTSVSAEPSEVNEDLIAFCDYLQSNFSEPEFQQISNIIQALALDKSKINILINLLNPTE